MTLDKAVAKYNATIDGMHCFDPKECQMCAEDKKALDTAVKDAMLAAGELGQRFKFYTRVGGHQWDRGGYEAEIERLFGEGRRA